MMSNFSLPEWIWATIVTVVIIGLIKYAWYNQSRRIDNLEKTINEWIKEGGCLTTNQHRDICNQISKARELDMNEMFGQFKEWLGLKLDIVNTQMSGLKADIEASHRLIDDKIENKILKELHKLNGKN